MKLSPGFVSLLAAITHSIGVNAALSVDTSSLETCPDTSNAEYDYVVVGSGAGGGPTAARLAERGFKVLVIEAGKDHVNYNTTVPLYLGRVTEDPEISLDYGVKNEVDSTKTDWYPRAQGLGGSTIHNAFINLIPHKWDFINLAAKTGDESWGPDNMFKYFTKIENNLYVPELIGKLQGRGYEGWLNTQYPPLNLLTDLDKIDAQLTTMFTPLLANVLPTDVDWNNYMNDGIAGGGPVILTKNVNGTRSSIRDRLIRTQVKYPQRLEFKTETIATKILMCKNTQGEAQAYGVETASGAYLLPVQAKFKGKAEKLTASSVTAKYEVIVSTGTYQTPQLLMLSGIGDQAQLSQFGIPTVVNSPGVGTNLRDRLEMTTVWKLRNDFVIYKGCTFGNDPATDPCLKTWIEKRNNLYSAGPATWAHSYKSDPKLPALDVWSMWGPATFKGYIKGWAQEIADNPNTFVNVVIKGHTASAGWVKLTGPSIQDKVEINKNQFVDANGMKDLEIITDAVQKSRDFRKQNPLTWGLWVTEEVWPGPAVNTREKLRDFIRENVWGHHACCTVALGGDNDDTKPLDKNFKVKGVKNLRVVDNSVWPEIPGFFVTTPIYMISEKAADAITANAQSNGWAPRFQV